MGDVLTVRIPEIVVPGRRLGSHIVHDERSKEHPADRAARIVAVVHKALGLPFNQANLGKCTCEATGGSVNSAPNYKPPAKPKTDKDTDELYKLETKDEGQPWPPNDPGGSGLEVCKAAKAMGWISRYTHAFGVQHALEALVKRPVITGIPWFDTFDSPDANGLVSLSRGAQIRGYHELVVLRIIPEHELVGLAQSWGKDWGVPDAEMGLPDGGAFYMSYETWAECLKRQGDVTVPIVG